jgi:hypothetical protein
MVCAEKIRLISAYAAVAERYANATAKLRTTTDEEFAEALIVSEAARTECNKARQAIREHRAEHCC